MWDVTFQGVSTMLVVPGTPSRQTWTGPTDPGMVQESFSPKAAPQTPGILSRPPIILEGDTQLQKRNMR